MRQNLVGKILGKIKIFVQDFVTIVTGISETIFVFDGIIGYKGLVFTNKILPVLHKVTSLDIYSTVAWARVLVAWERGKIKVKLYLWLFTLFTVHPDLRELLP